MNLEIKKIDNSYMCDIWDIMQKCYKKDFYQPSDKEFYYKVLSQGWSVGAFNERKLIGFSLSCFNDTVPQRLLDGKYDFCHKIGLEVMNGAVLPEYRGYGLASEMIKKNLCIAIPCYDFAWVTAHKDNISSCKSIENAGFKCVLENITLSYGKHRNLYMKGECL
ncbi:MAG: hypothetical protein E7279_01310 [Lachnospiraceae bacterium]|nr:hypothetical protein [Lachnospiraceae bacterium]